MAEKAPKQAVTAPVIIPVVYNISIPSDLVIRLTKFKEEKIFSSIQEVMRIAAADFLKRNGY